MKWEPWKLYRKEVETLDVKSPPCIECVYWKPQRKYMPLDTGQKYDGVILCHCGSGQETDFSCCVEKPTKKQITIVPTESRPCVKQKE
jgi:hypothetical protein